MTPDQRALSESLRKALLASNERLQALDADTRRKLSRLFDVAAEDIIRAIEKRAGRDGMVPASALYELLAAVGLMLGQLAGDQEQLLRGVVASAAQSGGRVADSLRAAADAGGVLRDWLRNVPDGLDAATTAEQAVWFTPLADGLVLSDRLWANYQGVRQVLEPVLVNNISRSQGARDATREALARGMKVDEAMLNRIELARAGALGDEAAAVLSSDAGKAYAAAERVFRTEMNRASLEASRTVAFALPDIAGTRFLLSPAHPRFDICDLYARMNAHGLGPGVYPPGQSPLPAHPNTLSYEEVVFTWEVEEQHKKQRETLFDLLAQRNEDEQGAVLQSADKTRELRAGRLRAEHILRPWRDIRDNYPDSP